MEGLLLDPLTGKSTGRRAGVPPSSEVNEWQEKVERELALDRTKDLLSRTEEFQATTTTNRYLAYPAAAAGISKASSGGAAWSFSTYVEIVPVNTITATYYIAGFTWMWHTPPALADTTYEVLFELATGLAGSEVLALQVPSSYRGDTLVGYVPSNFIVFPEPKQIAANTRISMRLAQSLATTVYTYSGIKIMYETV
jgi:hypothetical protein